MEIQEQNPEVEENLISDLISRFLPFWPLFALLVTIGLIGAWGYLKTVTPMYEASAKLIIKDENKGVDNSSVMKSIDPYETKKIVENEIEVIQSRKLMQNVVNSLHLYAPIVEKGTFKSVTAYASSPITVELKDPEKIPLHIDNQQPYYFRYDNESKKISVNGKDYPTDEWITGISYSDLKFTVKANAFSTGKRKLSYTFVNPKIVTQGLLDQLGAEATNKQSTVLLLFLQDASPERGEAILNGLIKAYNNKAIEDRDLLASNTLEFINDRMATVETELQDLEKKIQEYRADKNVVNLSEQGKLYLQDMGAYDRQIAGANQQMAVLEQVEHYVVSNNAQGGMIPSTLGVEDPVLDQLLNKLYDSEIKYERLKKTTAENNPLLSSVVNEIKKIRPSILQNIQNQKNNLKASIDNLSLNSVKSKSELSLIPKKERELLEISRQQIIKRDLFAFLQQKREETALLYAPSDNNSQIIDLAQSTLYPISPNSKIMYAIAMFLALCLGLVYVIVKEFLNRKILFRSEIQKYTGLQIISELPNIDYKDMHEMKRSKMSFWKILINGLKGSKSAKPTLFTDAPEIQDSFKQLGASLGLFKRVFEKKKILVTSSVPNEGKSFVSRNLANSLAKAGKKVALFDADFVRQNTSRQFELTDEKGTLDFLRGECSLSDLVHGSKINKNLCVIPVGNKKGDYTNDLLNGKIEDLFAYLDVKFDYVILDAAPIEMVADVNLISEFSDQTLLVVRHAVTPKAVMKNLRHSNMLKSLKNVSIVFNGIKRRGLVTQELGYGYGYRYDVQYTEVKVK